MGKKSGKKPAERPAKKHNTYGSDDTLKLTDKGRPITRGTPRNNGQPNNGTQPSAWGNR